MSGTVGILNVGAGDIALSFDPAYQAERIRAARIVKDMLRRGFALMVEVDRDGEKRFERALDFDESACRYIIADFDPIEAKQADTEDAVAREMSRPLASLAIDKGMEEDHGESGKTETETPETGDGSGTKLRKDGKPDGRGRHKRKYIDASTTRAVAVGRSAGG